MIRSPHQLESASERKRWSIYNRGTAAWDKACVSWSSSGACEVMSCVPHLSCATPLDAETGVADGSLSLARPNRRGGLCRNKPVSFPLEDRDSPRCLASLSIPATPRGASDFQRHLINPSKCPDVS